MELKVSYDYYIPAKHCVHVIFDNERYYRTILPRVIFPITIEFNIIYIPNYNERECHIIASISNECKHGITIQRDTTIGVGIDVENPKKCQEGVFEYDICGRRTFYNCNYVKALHEIFTNDGATIDEEFTMIMNDFSQNPRQSLQEAISYLTFNNAISENEAREGVNIYLTGKGNIKKTSKIVI